MKPLWIAGCVLAATVTATGAADAQGIGPDPALGGAGLLHIDNGASIPLIAQPAPVGTYVNRWTFLQEQKAELDDFVIYQNMWYRGGTELGPMGRYYLDLISNRMPRTPFPVVIATSRNDRLDEARREVIITLLERRGLTDPTRVIVAYPIAEGLTGEEASRVASFFLSGNLGGFGGFGGYGGLGLGGFGGLAFHP
jgi:hypothetical protein